MTSQSEIVGFNAALKFPDGSIWKRASGRAADLPQPISLTTDHLMGMGSITKTFIATTVLLLLEEEKLSLEDSIGTYLSSYPNIDGSATIRQLLSHQTGFNDYLNENPASQEVAFEDLSKMWEIDSILYQYVLEPNFAPGSSLSYSNTNFLLAGRIIEKITGQTWYEVVRQKILDPLDLKHTFAYPWEQPQEFNLSHAWEDLLDNGTVVDIQGLGIPDVGIFSLAASAGSLITTPEDLVIFTDKVFSGDFLKPETLIEMTTLHYGAEGENGLGFGLGTVTFPNVFGLENYGHSGGLIYQSYAIHFPTESLTVAIQQNDGRVDTETTDYIDLSDVLFELLIAYFNDQTTTATHEIEAPQILRLFPNPTDNQIFIKAPENLLGKKVSLIHLNGQIIQEKIVSESIETLEVGNLPSGIYLLRCGDNVQKIVKR